MKLKTNSQLHFLDNLSEHDELNQEVNFDLFVQSRRVTQITSALDKIFFSRSSQNSGWLQQNQTFINELVTELLDDSLLALDGVNLDGESLELSMKLMTEVRKALDVVRQIADGKSEKVN